MTDALFDDTAYATSLSLAERFVVPPFSVLNAASGEWQQRKTEWFARYPSIKTAVGREDAVGGVVKPSGRSDLVAQFAAIGDSISTFDPVLAEIAYRWWSRVDSQVFDPFSGGPVRGVVADVLGRRYHGIDIRQEQVDANIEAHDGSATWHCADAITYRPTACDLVFTCPPYGSLEVYSDLEGDLSTMSWDDFRSFYRRIVTSAISALRINRFAVFVVGNYKEKRVLRDLVGLTVASCGEAGAKYYGDLIYVTPVGTAAVRASAQFPPTRRPTPRHQMVLVFVKGDAREAAAYVNAGVS